MSKRKRMRDSLSEDALVSAERASCELHLKFNVVALEEQWEVTWSEVSVALEKKCQWEVSVALEEKYQ